MEQPSLTALAVSLAVLGVRQHRAWSSLVSDDAARLYAACVEEAGTKNRLHRLLSTLPIGVQFLLMDRLVAYGFGLHVALRKRAIEAQARHALKQGTRQVVVIGSGFDSLALRLAREFETVRCFELDREGTLALKQCALARARFDAPSHLRFVACDLGETTLQEVLSQEPAFDRTVSTFYVAEGLTMYLTEQENRALFSAVRACSEVQCTLAFTAIETFSTVSRPSALLRDKLLKRENSRFSWCIAPADMDNYLRGVGLRLQSVTTYQQLQSAFRTAPQRRRLERVSGEHVYVAEGRA